MTREEAIEIVKKHGILADGTKFESALRELIPELAESEDERIRKELISQVEKSRHHPADKARWIAYLEKQKEQKPAEWSDEDEEKLKAICTYLRDYPRLAKLGDKLRFNEYCDFLKSLRPSWKQSEVCYGVKGDPDPAGTSDLEEAAEKYADKHGFRVPYDGSNNYYDDVDVKASKEGFIAGAEWMRKKDVEDMVMSDNRDFLKCYEQGKFAMKLEMMKDAVDARITRILGSRDGSLELTVSGLDIPNYFFEGNKVKIIRG